MVISLEDDALLVAEASPGRGLGPAGRRGDGTRRSSWYMTLLGLAAVADHQVDRSGHLHDRPGTAPEGDEAVGGFEERFDQQVLDHRRPAADQHERGPTYTGTGPAQAAVRRRGTATPSPAPCSPPPQPGQGEQGLEQSLEARLDADQLGRRAVAEPGHLLLDVTHQLPGMA